MGLFPGQSIRGTAHAGLLDYELSTILHNRLSSVLTNAATHIFTCTNAKTVSLPLRLHETICANDVSSLRHWLSYAPMVWLDTVGIITLAREVIRKAPTLPAVIGIYAIAN